MKSLSLLIYMIFFCSWNIFAQIKQAGITSTSQVLNGNQYVIKQTNIRPVYLITKNHPIIPELKFANVFPNPFEDNIILEFNKPIPFDCQIKLLDMFGNIYKIIDVKTSPIPSRLSIELSHLPSGVYFLEINAGNLNLSNIKLVKITTN